MKALLAAAFFAAAAITPVHAQSAFNTGRPGYLPPWTGATSRRVADKLSEVVSVKDFAGVDSTGATDSTTGIAAGLASAVSTGKTLYFPCGSYLVSGGGAEIFKVTNAPIYIRGENSACTTLLVAASVPTTTDLFHHALTQPVFGTSITGIGTAGSGAARGRHVYFLDVSGTTAYLYGALFSDNLFLLTATGDSLKFNGPSAVGDPGCIGYSEIRNNNLISVNGDYIGDSVSIRNNIFNGAAGGRTGLYASQIVGAGNLKIVENSMSNSGGMIRIGSGVMPVIAFNEMEFAFPDNSTDHANIDIDGSIATVLKPIIFGNQLQVLAAAGTPGPDVIRINAATGAYIDGNRVSLFSASIGTAFHVRITASATSTYIGAGNDWITVTGALTYPRIFNLGAFNFTAAPAFTAPSANTVLHGDPAYGAGLFGPVASADMAAGAAAANVGTLGGDLRGTLPSPTLAGHVSGSGGPPVLSGCGTGSSLAGGATDLHGTVTEGTTASGCTLSFAANYGSAPDCVVTSPSGNTLTSYSTSTTALTLVNASVSGEKFSYHCMGN